MMSFRYFKIEEFDCKETGENFMVTRFIDLLDTLREDCNFAFHVNSGFRSKTHSAEINKEKPGMHTKGLAADIRVEGGWQRFTLVAKAIEHGFTGIGVAHGYIHLDLRETPTMWVY